MSINYFINIKCIYLFIYFPGKVLNLAKRSSSIETNSPLHSFGNSFSGKDKLKITEAGSFGSFNSLFL